MRWSAHWADSETVEIVDSRRRLSTVSARRRFTGSMRLPAFPRAMQAFLSRPAHFVRLTALLRNDLPEFLLVHLSKPLQVRTEQALVFTFAARLKFIQQSYRGVAIVRAHILANVASIHLPADSFAEFLRYAPAKFNRQIGDTLSRVENVRFNQRAGRTGIQTLPAIPAQVRRRRFGGPKRRGRSSEVTTTPKNNQDP